MLKYLLVSFAAIAVAANGAPAPKSVPATANPSDVKSPAPKSRTVSPIFESTVELDPQSPIDKLVFARLKELNIEPANLCSDGVFLRRAYLDVIGTLPTVQEATSFLGDRNPNKRAKLIDQLLARNEFADYWGMKWSDILRIKAEFPINLWPNAAQAYHRWIVTCLRENVPYDKMVREMLTSSGSNFRVAPVNFYRAMQNRDPQGIAQAVALTFMGTRAEKWPKEQLTNMSTFFGQVAYKSTGEWKEEIVYFDPGMAATNKLAITVFPDGKPAKVGAGQDPREVFANWLMAPSNPWFARNIANRVWSWLLGRGIIEEPDDIRPDNPPVNPQLLATLEQELIKAKYDLRQLYRVILNSQTYQLSSIPKTKGAKAEANFACYPLRRLEAEVLIDALNQVTGTTEKYYSAIPEPFTFMPEGQRSVELPDGSITSAFLDMFGRPSRDTGLEEERNNRPTDAQRLHLLNSSHIQRKLEQNKVFQNLLSTSQNPRDIVTGLYLMLLSRLPTEQELRIVESYSQTVGGGSSTMDSGKASQPYDSRQSNKSTGNKGYGKPYSSKSSYGRSGSSRGRDAAVDIAWALINSAEFLYRH